MSKVNFLFKPALSNVDSEYNIRIQNLFVVIRVTAACQILQLITKQKLNYQWLGKEFLLT